MSQEDAKPTYLSLETIDDRREIWSLIHRLPPAARLQYLKRCCAAVRATNKYGNGPVPLGMEEMVRDAMRCDRGNDRLSNAVYADIVNLAANMSLDLVRVALDLEAVAKGDVRPLAVAKLCGS